MGKTIAKIDLKTATEETATAVTKQTTDEKAIDKDDKGNSSDSEYSSLEDNDDDNYQGKIELNENLEGFISLVGLTLHIFYVEM